jgi:alpha-tubulin suppressor-like RCC1 family protein
MDARAAPRRGRAQPIPLLVVVLTAIVTFALTLPSTGAAFTGATVNPGNSLTATSDFGVGSLSAWGGTRVQASPLAIGARSDWLTTTSGYDTDCSIRADHTLWCSGYNGDGQVGVGDLRSRPDLTQVGTATNWTSIGAGRSPMCGTRSDTTLWCWGNNAYGAVGDGTVTATTRSSPSQVTAPSATGWAQLSVGYHQGCAIRTDTTLWCWGSDVFGQLGDGALTSRWYPVQVTSPASTGWTLVASGGNHTCALRTQALYCWGSNLWGQIGSGPIGNGVNQLTPLQIAGAWTAVAAGQLHTCALQSDSSLWCWGHNASGQLGLGNTTDATTPAHVGALTWSGLTASAGNTCATHTGDLWCWGDNTYGSVGDNTILNRTSPVQITTPATSGWSLPVLSSSGYRVCGIRTDGTLWCWGFGYATNNVPAVLDSGSDWRRPASGADFGCALKAVSQLYCWGVNGSGQLGLGTSTTTSVPTRVVSSGATDWAQVAAASLHTCAVGTDTTLWCWGYNGNGQLGIGSTASKTVPTQVTVPSSTGWDQVATGSTSSCAVRTDTTLYCWAVNSSGQLGNGTTTSSTSPVQVSVPATTGWSGVSVGSGFACARRPASQLYCWGGNSNGQLGTGGGTANQTTPAQVSGAWASVTTGATHTCAIDGSAKLWCWGYGLNGRLGLGTNTDNTTPAQVGTASDWHTVSGGSTFTCGTRAGPAVYCWGSNRYGQLGTGDNFDWITPQLVLGLSARPVATGSQALGVLGIR